MDQYEYIVHWVLARTPAQRRRVLDFGCGSGKVVAKLRAAGVEARGCDLYPVDRSRSVLATELGIAAISPMVEGKIPFPDNYFECVVSNMVFEHVVDIDLALDEIARVLRPGGVFLCLFPDLGVFREDHTCIPLLHWFGRESRFRVAWAASLRRLGFGHRTFSGNGRAWAHQACDYLDRWTVYRSPAVVRRTFDQRFDSRTHIEDAWLLARLGRKATWVRWMPAPVLRCIGRRFFTVAFVCNRPEVGSATTGLLNDETRSINNRCESESPQIP